MAERDAAGFALQGEDLAALPAAERARRLYALGDREPARSAARARFYALAGRAAHEARIAAAQRDRRLERKAATTVAIRARFARH